jgi:hypothetical protein
MCARWSWGSATAVQASVCAASTWTAAGSKGPNAPAPRRRASMLDVSRQPRRGPIINADGFQTVESRRRQRWPGNAAPKRHRPVPPELVGHCFNCLAHDQIAAECRSSLRCFRCRVPAIDQGRASGAVRWCADVAFHRRTSPRRQRRGAPVGVPRCAALLVVMPQDMRRHRCRLVVSSSRPRKLC